LEETGDRRRTEADLARREKRVESLAIHPLSLQDRERFSAAWKTDQARFVDDPAGAVIDADGLVREVMQARGYSVADFDQFLEDISVDYPHLVENYRAARDIVRRHERGRTSTEDLRKALVYYRGLLDDLLESQETTQ
jgi:hypothetical protein